MMSNSARVARIKMGFLGAGFCWTKFLKAGDNVQISGLKSRPDLNGQVAQVVGPSNEGRIGVKFANNSPIRVKVANLHPEAPQCLSHEEILAKYCPEHAKYCSSFNRLMEDPPTSSSGTGVNTGDLVSLHGLQSAAGSKLNGLKATVVGFEDSTGRFTVQLNSDNSLKAFKRENMKIVKKHSSGSPSHGALTAKELDHRIQELLNLPQGERTLAMFRQGAITFTSMSDKAVCDIIDKMCTDNVLYSLSAAASGGDEKKATDTQDKFAEMVRLARLPMGPEVMTSILKLKAASANRVSPNFEAELKAATNELVRKSEENEEFDAIFEKLQVMGCLGVRG